jgi:translation initiation factor 1
VARDPITRLGIEKRRGKPVTVCQVEGLSADELRALAKELRTACGAGGTAKQGAIEIQGDHRTRIRAVLTARGHRVKG